MQRHHFLVVLALVGSVQAGCGTSASPPSERQRANERQSATESPRPEMEGYVVCVTCTPDGKLLAYGNTKNRVYLLDVETGERRAVLEGHTGFVGCVAFSPDGKTLASGSDDTTVRLWDVATGKERASLKGHPSTVRSLAFSPDGKTLASGGFGA